jgi:hypothetical protein
MIYTYDYERYEQCTECESEFPAYECGKCHDFLDSDIEKRYECFYCKKYVLCEKCNQSKFICKQCVPDGADICGYCDIKLGYTNEKKRNICRYCKKYVLCETCIACTDCYNERTPEQSIEDAKKAIDDAQKELDDAKKAVANAHKILNDKKARLVCAKKELEYAQDYAKKESIQKK